MTVPPMPTAADGPSQTGQFDVYAQLLKNRIVMPPMTTVLGGADGEVTDRFIDFYAARARGGAALITAEAADVHPYTHNLSLGDRGFTAIYDDRFIPGLKRFTEPPPRHPDSLPLPRSLPRVQPLRSPRSPRSRSDQW